MEISSRQENKKKYLHAGKNHEISANWENQETIAQK